MSIFQSFDIETGGMVLGKHPLLAIGTSVYEYNKNGTYILLDTLEVHFHGNEEDYDPDTLDWWKQQDTWDTIKSNCVSLQEGAEMLKAFIEKWQQEAIFNRRTSYSVLTDNAWYDVVWIDWLLCTYTDEGRPLRQSYVGSYDKEGWMRIAHVIDVNQRVQGLSATGLGLNMAAAPKSVRHDHTPVHDSMGIAERWFHFLAQTKKLRKLTRSISTGSV